MSLYVSPSPHYLAKDSTRIVMLDVLIALLPTTAAGIYLFGLHAAWILCVSVITCIISEFVWQKLMKRPVMVGDLSCVVTGLILGLNLPSTAPLWLPAVGGVIAIILVKELFGGIGHNFMNPAMFARAFLLASWPARMTSFVLPMRLLGSSAASFSPDAIASPTPLAPMASSDNWQLTDFIVGNIPGSIGEVCKIAILIGLLYLLFLGVTTWHIPVIFLGTTVLLTWLISGDFMLAILSILQGGVMFGAVFMATDYASSPVYPLGKCLYAVGCGVMVVVIRKFGIYPEGVTFAILLMNCVTPLLDRFTVRRVYGVVKKHA